MQPMPMTVSLEDPLHFRVRDITPNPLSTSSLDQLVLSIAYADKPGTIYFSMSVDVLAPYREALQEAITAQAVFWVNWHYPDSQLWPATPHDSTLDRLLEAVRNHQVVPNRTGRELPHVSDPIPAARSLPRCSSARSGAHGSGPRPRLPVS